MKKILAVFGTRPEAIKMCPLVTELKRRKQLCVSVAVTAQHRNMLDGVLSEFGVVPDFDLDLMRRGQTPSELTEKILGGIGGILDRLHPDLVLVHGDTTTAFASALAAFYRGLPIGHVEAGLRTGDLSSPFPEEFNRRAVGLMSTLHFAPTQKAAENLRREGYASDRIFVTGNTVIDALKTTLRPDFDHHILRLVRGKKLFFLTTHRREIIGEPMRQMLGGVARAAELDEVAVVCPMHKNPTVRAIIRQVLGNSRSVILCEPFSAVDCHNIMARCFAVLTDSGGIQEEAAAMGIPTLVLRDTTERPEGVEAGILRPVGTDGEVIYNEIRRLLTDAKAYADMKSSPDLYGDGRASERIADILSDPDYPVTARITQ